MYIKMCVASPHNSAGMVIIMWYQIIKFSPATNDTFAQRELKLFQIDKLTRSCHVWHPKIAETQGNLGAHIESDKSTYRNSVCKQEGQLARLFQDGMFIWVNCSRIVWCI